TYRTDGGHNCVGPDKSYRTCNIQDCPEGSKDFREEQCAQFDGTDFQGKRYKWLPYYGAENPCELNCMPRGENFFYRHRSSVVDGTPCHPGRRDVCVEGVCKRLGCDNVLESAQQEDPCLQCGGNGQSCYQVKNSFSVRAIKNLRGEYYLNGHWVIEFSRATPIAGTMLYYQRGAEGDNVPETIIGRGPTTEPLVVELISQEPNQGVEYEFYLPNGRSREGYYWSFGSWSTCSRECGSGYQSRLVFCTIDNEAYPDYLCASLPRPQTNRTCNPHVCPQIRSWKTGEWNTCSVTCGGGSQVRSVQCVSHDAAGPRVVEDAICAAYAEAPPSLQTCNMQQCAEYQVTRWSACSVTCGSGEQTREVTCVGSAGMRLEETSCSALLRPTAVRPCEMAACLRQISWHVGDWGLCSKSCGSGSRERQVICSDQERNLYPVSQCNAHPKPSTMERCNTQSCYSPQGECMQHCSDLTDHKTFLLICHVACPQAPSLPTENAAQCRLTTYGCCYDRTTPAGGPNGEGCPNPPNHIEHSICSLPRSAGSCSTWTPRYHYDVITSKCLHFWYGSCHGNSNNFMTRADCQRACQAPSPSQQGPGPLAPAGEPTPRRESTPGSSTSGGGSTAGGSTGAGSRNMGRIFTVQGGTGTGRQATSAASHAHRARVHLRPRRPSPATAAQHMGPAAR
uniref:Papilin, proteoglycan like sulfated glycoprotein n=1 Tax=Sander lucioperca TaxID=283035 RepID=A0A8C9ZXM9_SANLU